jgi:predicted amino acid-binding ACT domain protein
LHRKNSKPGKAIAVSPFKYAQSTQRSLFICIPQLSYARPGVRVKQIIAETEISSMPDARQVISICGDDRPGILDDVCSVIQRNSGRITDLHTIDVGGQFAMLCCVHIAESAVEALRHQMNELAGYTGLRIIVSRAVTSRALHQYMLRACGTDHVGVLKKISHLLRVLNINIQHIDVHTQPDQHATMILTLGVPRECPVTKLKEFFAQLLGPTDMRWELSAVP